MKRKIHWLKRKLLKHESFILLAMLFAAFRILAPLAFRVGSFFTSSAPDFYYGFQWGTLSHSGFWPFVDYWREYPPGLPWFSVLAYRLSLLLPAWTDQRLWFAVTLRELLALFEVGSLILVYSLARQLHEPRRALRCAWLYAGLFVTFYAASGWWEPLPLFLTLLALWGSIYEWHWLSAGAVGLGFMTKVFPIIVAPMGLRRTKCQRQALIYIGIISLVALLVAAPFLDQPGYLIAYFKQALQRSSWQTVWALLEGYFGYGKIPQSPDRFFTPSAGDVRVHPTTLPWGLIHLTFAAFFLFLYTRRIDWQDKRRATAFVGLTLTLFFLWSKGYSGQFAAYLVAPIVLLLPNWRGVLYLVTLSVLYVAEWPLSLVLLQGQKWFQTAIVLGRTIALIALALEFAAQVFRPPSEGPEAAGVWQRIPRVATSVALGGNLVGAAILTPLTLRSYAREQLSKDPAMPAIETIRQSGRRDMPIVFAHPTTYRRLYATARHLGPVTQVPSEKDAPERAREAWLREMSEHGPFWLVIDESNLEMRQANLNAEKWIAARACRAGERWAGKARLARFVAAEPTLPLDVSADFDDGISLAGVWISARQIRPGSGLCLKFNWRAEAAPSTNYTVFVHLLDDDGQLVAQTDQQPGGGTKPTGDWEAGSSFTDRHGLILPPNTSPGTYQLQVGLYDADGARLLVKTAGGNGKQDHVDLTTIQMTEMVE